MKPVSSAAHMYRRTARGDVAATFLRAGSVAAALLRVGCIDVALLRAARALSVQKRYVNEWSVQKRYGNERHGGRCGGRGVSAVSEAARRGEWSSEESGAASRDGTAQRSERLSETRRIGSEKRPRAGIRGRLGSACGDTTLRVETRARGRTASWTTCWDTSARRF